MNIIDTNSHTFLNGNVIRSNNLLNISAKNVYTPPSADCGPKIYPIAPLSALNGAMRISNTPPKIPLTVSTTKFIGTIKPFLIPSQIALNPPTISPLKIIIIPPKILSIFSNTAIIAVPKALIGAIIISNIPPKIPPIVSITNPIGTTNKSIMNENIFLRDSTSGNASSADARFSIPRAFNAHTVISLSMLRGSAINQSKSFINPSLRPPKMPPSENPSINPLMNPIAATIPATTPIIGSARGTSAAPKAVIAATTPEIIAGIAAIDTAKRLNIAIMPPKIPPSFSFLPSGRFSRPSVFSTTCFSTSVCFC